MHWKNEVLRYQNFYIFFGVGTIHTAQKMKISIKGQIYRRNPSFFVNFTKFIGKHLDLGLF